MGKKKDYYCCICHDFLNHKPLRLVKQVHDGRETYGKYFNMQNYDFCEECYKKFDRWIKKHEQK